MAINQLKLVGKSSGDIFVLRYPKSLLDFCGFDFSEFAKSAIDLCNEALKNGAPDYDRISELRREVQSAHCYIENNIRTVYDKIVFDCWIDYVCRRDNIGESGLWNRLIRCKTPFDKAIFARLCEFRYNRASNEWLNIIRVQDYAKSKLEFVFGKSLDSVDDAAARRNYFDMMFSVTAREMGCRLEDLGSTKVFSVGRIPPAPFMFPNVSKEIVRHVLTNFDYSDDYSEVGDYSESDDRISMEAFSRMKAGLPKDLAGYNISSNITDKHNGKIYMPCSLKAAVDLEFDAIIDDGSWLARCKRCQRFFLRNREHPEEYCSRSMPGEKSCLEIYEEEHPRPTITEELENRCKEVTDIVYARVDKTMSVKEYDSWRLYLQAMVEKVKKGEIPSVELENFLDYSLEVDISKSRPIEQVEKHEPEPTPHERVIKPFIPERISRSELPAAAEPKFEEPEPAPRAPKEGFFTSPTVQRQKNERPQISHIIRNGESLGDNGGAVKLDPAGFRPFGAPPAAQSTAPSGAVQGIRAAELPQFGNPNAGAEQAPKKPAVRAEQLKKTSTYEKFNLLEERIETENRIRREMAERLRSGRQAAQPIDGAEPSSSKPTVRRKTSAESVEPRRADYDENIGQDRDERFEAYGSVKDESGGGERFEPYYGQSGESPKTDGDSDKPRSDERLARAEESADDHAPRTRVIRKNAAAISAYGKAAGASFATADPLAKPAPETEPFKDIGSIFDVLERSESGGERSSYETRSEEIARTREENGGVGDDDREFERRRGSSYDDRNYGYDKPRGGSSEGRYYESERSRGGSSEGRYYESERSRGEASEGRYYESERSREDSSEVRIYDPKATRGERFYEPEQPRREISEDHRSSREDGEKSTEDRAIPERVTDGNVPTGIWTEDRHLFPHDEDDQSANDSPSGTAKDKRHKSNKTQRLYDMITREPDNNPNFRKK